MTIHTMLVDADMLHLGLLCCVVVGIIIGCFLATWYYEDKCPWCQFSDQDYGDSETSSAASRGLGRNYSKKAG
jgi:hypothetical protein